jgi:hypothetical protein
MGAFDSGCRRLYTTLRRAMRAAPLLTVFCLVLAHEGTAQTKTCFPTCDERDGRFLSLVGTNLESLAGDQIIFSFRVPADAPSFVLELFDGETGGLWDKGTNPVIYEVYADPDGDGLIEAGEVAYGPYSGAGMADNAWSAITVPTTNDARLSSSGPFFYTVRMRLQDPSIAGTWSNFKLRANADILLETNNFAFASPLFTNNEAAIIYPNFDPANPTSAASLANSRYDGAWSFFMTVEKARVFGSRPDTGYVDIWDGDMDFGSYDCSSHDTDDPNTPNAPYLPAWAAGTTAVPEGAVTNGEPCRNSAGDLLPGGGMTSSNPADDNLNPLYRRSPAINYVIIGPDGAVYANTNPSGSQEWERFSVSLLGGVPMVHDIATSSLPDGIYEVRIAGMDLNNLNAWHSTFRFIGVCPDGRPCPPPPEECPTCTCYGSTATKGYWKNHPGAWPVTSLMIGGRMRNQAALLDMLSGTGIDKFYILASQLVAAKLNVANGAASGCIATTITQADAWVSQYESQRPIRGGSAWNVGNPLASTLDLYNNGKMCAPHRDDQCAGGSGDKGGKGKEKGLKLK